MLASTKPPGPSPGIISKIERLNILLCNLPTTLPERALPFGLDDSDLQEEGHWYAFNRSLEVAFQTHTLNGRPLLIKQCSCSYSALIDMIKVAIRACPNEHELIQEAWIERLIKAAELSGAKYPSRKRRKSDSAAPEHEAQPLAKQMCIASTTEVIELDSDGSEDSEDSEDSDKNKDISSKNVSRSSSQTSMQSAQTLKQSTLSFRKLTKEEADRQSRKIFARQSETLEADMARARQEKERKQQKKRDLTKIRVQRFREREREYDTENRAIGKIMTLVKRDASSDVLDAQKVAEESRAATTNWKKSRTGKRGGVVKEVARRTNWFQPFLWVHIDKAAKANDWSESRIVKQLQLQFGPMYEKLHRGTISHWKEPGKKCWSEITLANVARGRVLTGTGRVGVLTPYPNVVKRAKECLIGMRNIGLPVTTITARAVIISEIESECPALLAYPSKFKCSEKFVHSFLASIMGWSIRRGTRAAAHIPSNADEVCERAFFRMANLVKEFDIPSSLIINMDQTGVIYVPGFQFTYEETGSKQVSIVGKDEKRGYTLCVATAADGTFLPFQQVCGGKTQLSTPDAKSDGYQEAIDSGFDLTFAASVKNPNSHFSTLKTMKEWVERLCIRYIQEVITKLDLPCDQRAILFIDSYPVHTGREFRSYMQENHPNIFLLYVPANCTGIFQPADVGLQRVIKHRIKQLYLEKLVDMHREQVSKGNEGVQAFTGTTKELRNSSVTVRSMLDVYKLMNTIDGRELVKMAWRKCAVGNYNLSEDCLTSRNTRAKLREYIVNDDMLRNEILNRTGKSVDELTQTEDAEDDEDDSHAMDDSTVSLHEIIQAEFKDFKGFNHSTRPYESMGSSTFTEPDLTGLTSAAQEEDIWAYDEDGRPLDNGK